MATIAECIEEEVLFWNKLEFAHLEQEDLESRLQRMEKKRFHELLKEHPNLSYQEYLKWDEDIFGESNWVPDAPKPASLPPAIDSHDKCVVGLTLTAEMDSQVLNFICLHYGVNYYPVSYTHLTLPTIYSV